MAAQSKLISEADVPARPAKLSKTATAEEKADREAAMKERRKLMERLREQKRDRTGEQRTRPPKEEESRRRAQQRPRITASVAFDAVAAAAMPLTNEG